MKKVTIDNNSLAHTSWNCKYHIVFVKKRRKNTKEHRSGLLVRKYGIFLCKITKRRWNFGKYCVKSLDKHCAS